MIRAALAALLVAGLGLGAFALAVEHPATKGPTRCWIQETFYTQEWDDPPAGTPVVEAVTASEPMRDLCDAADDPAIVIVGEGVWVIGTNKQRSLNVYDLSGVLVGRADDLGAPNNVDMRELDGRFLVMASDKDDAQIEAFAIDPATGALSALAGAPFEARAEDEVYGLCLHRAGKELFAFTTDKSGLIVQYRIEVSSTGARAKDVRELRVPTQPEGCVVDDAVGALYVGEEDAGIWKFNAAPSAGTEGQIIASTGANATLTADVEGLAIYSCETGANGFLIASSQGDNSYAVFERAPPHGFLGKFQVRSEGAIVGDTDGLDLTAQPLGSDYPKGMLVVQDGFIRDASGNRRNQKFAYVSWADVETALGLKDVCMAT